MQSYSGKSEDYFAHARKEILPLLPTKRSSVLEVGCGSGATLGWLKEIHRATRTVGIEISEMASNAARFYADEVYCADFENDEIAIEGQKFDVILCLDVLEHMVDPWKVVNHLVTKYLEIGGTLIVSLPNVRHYSVVLPLFFAGRWDYSDAGLLDKTHLRFFTRDTAKLLLVHSHLGVISCTAMGFGRWTIKNIINILTFGIFEEFVIYQHYLTAKRVR